MLVYRYDKTFEGLLTALFDAYARRTFPDAIAGEHEPGVLLETDSHTIRTDRAKAERVWQGLMRRLPHGGTGMLVHVWLSEEPESDMLLLRFMRKVFDAGGRIATDFTDRDVLAVKKLADKVSREREYLAMFLRFQQAADGTYYAPVTPKYNALPLVVPHLRDRFADQRWLVYDLKRSYGYYYDLAKVSEVTFPDEDERPGEYLGEEKLAQNEQLFQQLWKGYFRSMAIRERINPRLQRRNMPTRFWRHLTEKQ